MEKVRHIFYRGSLKFCNYSCSYCPFSKSRWSEGKLRRDKEELFRFVNRVADDEFRGAVQIVPYGEALIHEYYWEALARLSALPDIEAVGAQTNLSFPVEKMLSIYEQAGGNRNKLRLWGTFHSEMVSVEAFLAQCNRLLQKNVTFCVGGVGVPEKIECLRKLRDGLDSSVYVWVNKMDGLGRNYTPEEVAAFVEIDEYFELELRHYKADKKRCQTSVFVEGSGKCYPCNRCKNSVGNIYETSLLNGFREKEKMTACGRKECDCYIAYSNRSDMEELVFFQPYPAFRIPSYKRAVFFDIDGTLVADGEREISGRRVAWLRGLATHSDIFLVTSLPYEDAMRKLRPVAEVICGGVFAGGGRLRIVEKNSDMPNWEQVYAIENRVLDCVKDLQEKYSVPLRKYKRGDEVYKVTLRFLEEEIQKEVLERLTELRDICHIITEDNRVEITAAGVSKLSGLRRVCHELELSLEEIAVFGNSETDLEMLRVVPFSVAAAGSCEAVKEVAKVVLE